MRAWRDAMPVEEVPDPECPPDGVVLRVLACGVCRSDHHASAGADPDVALPHICGHELSGEVIEAGPEVRRWRSGTRVVAPFVLGCGRCGACASGEATVCADQAVPGFTMPGGFAEAIAMPRADFNLAPLPDGMAASHAAVLGCRVTTAFRALADRAALVPGEWLAVHGCGGVGLSAVMLGRAMGARVVAVDVVPEKLALARELGAEVGLDARDGPSGEAVREVTQGGAHVSLEALGLPVTFEQSVRSLRPLGRHVQVGMPTGEGAHPALPLDVVYSRQLSLHGTRGMPAHRFGALFALLQAGGIDLARLVEREVSLEEAGASVAALDGFGGVGVRVVVP